MAIRWYRPVSAGTELELYVDPGLFSETQDQADLAVFQEAQASSDTIREQLAAANAFTNLGEYDLWLQDQIWAIQDRLDYYSYEDRVENRTVRDGAWFSPIAIEAVCGEEVGREAVNSIDGDTGTSWRHISVERHSITFQLRDYPKKISSMRIWFGGSESDREQLQNIDVFASRGINDIDDPANERLSGFTPTWAGQGDSWVEIPWTSKINKGRYIKLLCDSARGDGTVQIREIEFRVETRDP